MRVIKRLDQLLQSRMGSHEPIGLTNGSDIHANVAGERHGGRMRGGKVADQRGADRDVCASIIEYFADQASQLVVAAEEPVGLVYHGIFHEITCVAATISAHSTGVSSVTNDC